jgi:hypothetical protein
VKSPGWKAAYAPGLAGKMRWSLGASVRSPTSLSEPVKKAPRFLSPRTMPSRTSALSPATRSASGDALGDEDVAVAHVQAPSSFFFFVLA